MKISIDGAFSTGKSTILKNLEKQSYNVLYDLERKLINKLGNPKDFNQYELTLFQKELFGLQMEAEQSGKYEFYDGGLYTMLAYLKTNDKKEYDKYKKLISLYLKGSGYDKVFLTLNELKIEDDGVRSIDKKYQEKIHKTILEVLKEFKQDYTILKGGIKERINTIIFAIKE